MIANKKTEVPKENLIYLAVIWSGDTGRVLITTPGHLRRTVAHETAIGSTIIGEFTDQRVAERAARLFIHGWRQASNIGT